MANLAMQSAILTAASQESSANLVSIVRMSAASSIRDVKKYSGVRSTVSYD